MKFFSTILLAATASAAALQARDDGWNTWKAATVTVYQTATVTVPAVPVTKYETKYETKYATVTVPAVPVTKYETKYETKYSTATVTAPCQAKSTWGQWSKE